MVVWTTIMKSWSNVLNTNNKGEMMPNKNFNNPHSNPPSAKRPDSGVYPASSQHSNTYPASSKNDSKGVSSASPHSAGAVKYNMGAKGNNASNKG